MFATVRARRNSIGYVGYNLLVNGFLRARYVRLINKAGEVRIDFVDSMCIKRSCLV